MNTTKRLLLQAIDSAFDKKSWHGPNLMSALRGVTPQRAAQSLPGRKSIWQQALHAAYWKHATLNKLVGTTPFGRPGSNWPRLPKVISSQTWRADLDFLIDEHRRLRAAIARLPDRRLTKTLAWQIQGIAAHDIYHAGQIRLLRRLIP